VIRSPGETEGPDFFEAGLFLAAMTSPFAEWNFSSVTGVYKELKLNWKDSY